MYYSQVYTTCKIDEKYIVILSWNDLYQEYGVTEKKEKVGGGIRRKLISVIFRYWTELHKN